MFSLLVRGFSFAGELTHTTSCLFCKMKSEEESKKEPMARLMEMMKVNLIIENLDLWCAIYCEKHCIYLIYIVNMKIVDAEYV